MQRRRAFKTGAFLLSRFLVWEGAYRKRENGRKKLCRGKNLG